MRDESQNKTKRCFENHRLPETKAGQDSALGATACQSHSPTIGSQAPWREKDQAVESDRASGGVRWIAGGGTSGVELMEQVTERTRWKSLEQTTESVTRDSKDN
ncbi:hypothetical protein F2Q68_00043638 [Brassica cretica]|uniref:Uncharacterized protein n=1 Tax=Brassica cretica TaxID=69181 RepID=A0A8S9LPJ3_BRACR|nr:hypothetical protein F2Q68_00043638 [Brassica cretica]